MTQPTSVESFTIRHVEENDASLILWFIKGLAEYEKLSHEVVATEEELREYLFGPRPMNEWIINHLTGEELSELASKF